MRIRWKTTIAIAMIMAASFTAGTFANQVIVQQIQSLAGNHVLVPAPELQIVSSSFVINGTASLVTGVILNVTTVGQPGVPVGTKVYQVFIQVSCLNSALTEYTCATGSNTISLPTNGGQGILTVPITPPIDPETVEIHDLSFIVTGTPSPISGCTADFTITATPVTVTLNETATGTASATVIKTLTSLCNFSGTITLNAKIQGPPGLTATFSTPTVNLAPGGSAIVKETITATNVAPGAYPILNFAVSGTLNHFVQVTANVINTPPPCTPGFVITIVPKQLFLNHTLGQSVNVTKTITSTCGFSGTVSLSTSSNPAGLKVSLSAPAVTINPQLSAVVTETITAPTTTMPGPYTVTNTGTAQTANGPISFIAQVFVQVV